MTSPALADRYEPFDDSDVAVAIVMAAHKSYTFRDDDSGRTPTLHEAVRAGHAKWLRDCELTGLFGVWVIDEDGVRKRATWGRVPHEVAAYVKIAKSGRSEDADPISPPFYASLIKIFEDIGARSPDLPGRKVVVVVTDGKDALLGNKSARDAAVAKLAALANTHHIALVGGGITLDLQQPLDVFAGVVKAVGGTYVDLDDNLGDRDDITARVAGLQKHIHAAARALVVPPPTPVAELSDPVVEYKKKGGCQSAHMPSPWWALMVLGAMGWATRRRFVA